MNWWSMQNWLSEGKLHVGSLIQTLNEFFICDYNISNLFYLFCNAALLFSQVNNHMHRG